MNVHLPSGLQKDKEKLGSVFKHQLSHILLPLPLLLPLLFLLLILQSVLFWLIRLGNVPARPTHLWASIIIIRRVSAGHEEDVQMHQNWQLVFKTKTLYPEGREGRFRTLQAHMQKALLRFSTFGILVVNQTLPSLSNQFHSHKFTLSITDEISGMCGWNLKGQPAIFSPFTGPANGCGSDCGGRPWQTSVHLRAAFRWAVFRAAEAPSLELFFQFCDNSRWGYIQHAPVCSFYGNQSASSAINPRSDRWSSSDLLFSSSSCCSRTTTICS